MSAARAWQLVYMPFKYVSFRQFSDEHERQPSTYYVVIFPYSIPFG